MRAWWLAPALLLSALAGPAAPARALLPPTAVPIPVDPRLDPPADARFRFVAGQTRELLAQESCRPRPALRRAVVLAGEIAEARAFEAGLTGPARFHWDIARDNLARRQAGAQPDCWDDSDPDFARIHVQMARDGIRRGLQEMRSLVAALPPLPDGAAAPPARAADFRARAGDLAQLLDPLCSGQATDTYLAPARAELTGLRQRLAGTPYALQLELGLADALYFRGIPECIEYAPVPEAVATSSALQEARRQIGLLEALVRR